LTPQRVRFAQNALDALGRTANDVANTLESLNIRGVRQDPTCCPVAEYMKAQRFPNVGVTLKCIDLDVWDYGPETYLSLPDPVAESIYWFDEGKLPQLEKQEVASD
jgi:hypothetical protein